MHNSGVLSSLESLLLYDRERVQFIQFGDVVVASSTKSRGNGTLHDSLMTSNNCTVARDRRPNTMSNVLGLQVLVLVPFN